MPWLVAPRPELLAICCFTTQVAVVTLCAQGYGSETAPQFQDYVSKSVTIKKDAALDLTTGRARDYRTRLREAIKLPANFASHYRLVLWGCGTGCAKGAAVDKSDGRVIFLPFTICCSEDTSDNFEPIAYRQDSRLIVFSGLMNEAGVNGAHYYVFDGRKFGFLKTIPAH
jgi:hypothetical protein